MSEWELRTSMERLSKYLGEEFSLFKNGIGTYNNNNIAKRKERNYHILSGKILD